MTERHRSVLYCSQSYSSERKERQTLCSSTMPLNVSLLVLVCVIFIELYVKNEDLRSELNNVSAQLRDKTIALEAKRLEVMESDLFNELSEQVSSLKVDRDDLRESELKLNSVNDDLNNKLNLCEWKIEDLGTRLEDERRDVRSLQSELSQTKKHVDQLRNENDNAKRKIDHLEYKIRNDPRNGCACLCSDFDMARFCITKVYYVATYLVRHIPGSSFILGLTDKLMEWIEPEVHLLEYRKEHSRLLY